MSLKKRIVLWYSVWSLILSAIIFILFILFSNSLSLRNLRHDTEEALSDAAEDVLRGRDDLDEFDDGVYTYLYSTSGERLFGRYNERIDSIPYREGQRVLNFPEGTWVISDMMMDGFYIRTAAELTNIYTLLSSDYLPLVIASPILLLISALGGLLIVKRAFRPFDDLVETASKIADADDLSLRLKSGKTEEEKKLSIAFNSMLSRLDESFKRQKEFTDDASHELRTPIAVIKAESEYAISSLDDKNEVEESLKVINAESDRMARLVDSLLMLSRSDRGSLKANKTKFSLSDLLSTIAESMEERAKGNGLTLKTEIEDATEVYADVDMLTRAIINLIENAISYSKERGTIEIKLKDKKLSVIDDGIGIREEDQERIFERFFQVDKSRSGSSSGLGLSMVKEIADLNDIEIEVESEIGKGSRFTLIF